MTLQLIANQRKAFGPALRLWKTHSRWGSSSHSAAAGGNFKLHQRWPLFPRGGWGGGEGWREGGRAGGGGREKYDVITKPHTCKGALPEERSARPPRYKWKRAWFSGHAGPLPNSALSFASSLSRSLHFASGLFDSRRAALKSPPTPPRPFPEELHVWTYF